MSIYIECDNGVHIEPNDVTQATLDVQISRPPTFKATVVGREKYRTITTGVKIQVTSYVHNEVRFIGQFIIYMMEPSKSADVGPVFQLTATDEATVLLKKTGMPNKTAFDTLTMEQTIEHVKNMVTYDHLGNMQINWYDRNGVDFPNINTSSATNMLEVLTAATTYTGYQMRFRYNEKLFPLVEVGNFGFQRNYLFVERDDGSYTQSELYLESQGIFFVEQWSAVQSNEDQVDSLYAEGGNYTVTFDEGQSQELLLTTTFEFGMVPEGYEVIIMQTPWRDPTYYRPIMAVRTDRLDPLKDDRFVPRDTRRVVFGGIVPNDPPGGGGPNGVEISNAAQMLLQAAIRYFTTIGSPKVTVRLMTKRDVSGMFDVGDKVRIGMRIFNLDIPQETLDAGLYIVSFTHTWTVDGCETGMEVCTQLDALSDPSSLIYSKGNMSDRMIAVKKYPFYQQRIQLDEITSEVFHYFPEVYHMPPTVEILSVSPLATAKIEDIRNNYVHIKGSGYYPIIVTIKVTPKST